MPQKSLFAEILAEDLSSSHIFAGGQIRLAEACGNFDKLAGSGKMFMKPLAVSRAEAQVHLVRGKVARLLGDLLQAQEFNRLRMAFQSPGRVLRLHPLFCGQRIEENPGRGSDTHFFSAEISRGGPL